MLDAQTGIDVEVLVAGAAAVTFELADTRQVRLFSQPQPSLSGSLAEETQTGKPPLVVLVELVCDCVAVVVTRQLRLFSQPHPSPSISLAED